MKILFVDDDEMQVESMARYLKLRGHEVSSALHFETAREFLMESETEFDFLVTDYDLGFGKTGLDLIKIAQGACGYEPTTVLMSGLTRGGEAKAAGIYPDHMLTKGYDSIQQLEKILEEN